MIHSFVNAFYLYYIVQNQNVNKAICQNFQCSQNGWQKWPVE